MDANLYKYARISLTSSNVYFSEFLFNTNLHFSIDIIASLWFIKYKEKKTCTYEEIKSFTKCEKVVVKQIQFNTRKTFPVYTHPINQTKRT